MSEMIRANKVTAYWEGDGVAAGHLLIDVGDGIAPAPGQLQQGTAVARQGVGAAGLGLQGGTDGASAEQHVIYKDDLRVVHRGGDARLAIIAGE